MDHIVHSKIYLPAAPTHPTPLLILHGMMGLSDNWATLSRHYCEKGITVHAIDLPSHGRSEHIPEPTIPHLAQCIQEYMIRHNINKTNILGHSLGGKTAMYLACKTPSKIERLIVADISTKKYDTKSLAFILDAVISSSQKTITSREEAQERLSHKIKDPITISFLLKSLYRKEDKTYDFRFDALSLRKNIEQLSEALPPDFIFSGKTLFLKGELSPYIQTEDLEEIKKHFPHYNMVTLKNADHWVHVDAQEHFFNATISFLME